MSCLASAYVFCQIILNHALDNFIFSVFDSSWFLTNYFVFQFVDNPEEMDNLTNFNIITDNFLRVNIYLSDMEVEIQEQRPSYPLSNLFSAIGGTLGLWIGLSLLTVIELVQLLARLGCLACGVEWI